jgi:hypothetical protein
LQAHADQVTQLQSELEQRTGTSSAIADAEVKVLQGKLSVRDQQIDLLNAKLSDMHSKLTRQLADADEDTVSERGM